MGVWGYALALVGGYLAIILRAHPAAHPELTPVLLGYAVGDLDDPSTPTARE